MLARKLALSWLSRERTVQAPGTVVVSNYQLTNRRSSQTPERFRCFQGEAIGSETTRKLTKGGMDRVLSHSIASRVGRVYGNVPPNHAPASTGESTVPPGDCARRRGVYRSVPQLFSTAQACPADRSAVDRVRVGERRRGCLRPPRHARPCARTVARGRANAAARPSACFAPSAAPLPPAG